MADIARPFRLRPSLDRVVAAIAAILALVALIDPGQLLPTILSAANSLAGTAPIIAFAVLAIAWMKAAEAEALVGRAFTGREVPMILLAAMVGGLSPFCSCQVIPFIAALLAAGAPLSAVMAFWLASPLMDPAMFVITAGVLGPEFAIGKTVFAVLVGLFGGFVVWAFANGPVFADPLKSGTAPQRCCGSARPSMAGSTEWRFWRERERMRTFGRTARENALFLGKWLALAYVIEALMVAQLPAGAVAQYLGGEGMSAILAATLIGAPAYLNGFAAVPLVAALIEQGMSQGAAMAFMIAGGVSCIPAAVAVWALVRPRVFAAYLGFAISGAFVAGSIWSLLA